MIDPREPWTPEQIKEVWPVLVFLPEYMREQIDPLMDVSLSRIRMRNGRRILVLLLIKCMLIW